MAFSYPEFHGRSDEDVEDFLEQFEVATISNHVDDEALILRLLRICLKGDARKWFLGFEDQQKAVARLSIEGIKQALLLQFRRVEDPSLLWQLISGLKQKEDQQVDDFVWEFNDLWTRWCMSLGGEVPPAMIKKSMFVRGLAVNLQLKVELKQPATFEDAVQIAKEKEWKIHKQMELGMDVWRTLETAETPNVYVIRACESKECAPVMHMPVVSRQIERGMYELPPSVFATVFDQKPKGDFDSEMLKDKDAPMMYAMDVEAPEEFRTEMCMGTSAIEELICQASIEEEKVLARVPVQIPVGETSLCLLSASMYGANDALHEEQVVSEEKRSVSEEPFIGRLVVKEPVIEGCEQELVIADPVVEEILLEVVNRLDAGEKSVANLEDAIVDKHVIEPDDALEGCFGDVAIEQELPNVEHDQENTQGVGMLENQAGRSLEPVKVYEDQLCDWRFDSPRKEFPDSGMQGSMYLNKLMKQWCSDILLHLIMSAAVQHAAKVQLCLVGEYLWQGLPQRSLEQMENKEDVWSMNENNDHGTLGNEGNCMTMGMCQGNMDLPQQKCHDASGNLLKLFWDVQERCVFDPGGVTNSMKIGGLRNQTHPFDPGGGLEYVFCC